MGIRMYPGVMLCDALRGPPACRVGSAKRHVSPLSTSPPAEAAAPGDFIQAADAPGLVAMPRDAFLVRVRFGPPGAVLEPLGGTGGSL